MKWIGQHIWDFISRFRSDVYLEATETGTIASGGNLGLDSNNKVVKADTEAGELAFSGGTANGVLTYGGAAQIDVEDKLTWNPGTGRLTAEANIGPYLELVNINNDILGGTVTLKNQRGTSVTTNTDGDELGRIQWVGTDSQPGTTTFAQIVGKVGDNTNTEEAGTLSLEVGEYDGTLTTGLLLDGDTDADGEIDVTIGAGAASVTTIAGTLTMGSTAFVNNSGVVQVATQGTIDHDSLANYAANEHYTQANIVATGTIASGTWQGTAIASAYLDADTAHLSGAQTFTGVKVFNSAKILNRTLSITPGSSAGEFDGDVVYTGTTTSMDVGELYFYNSSGTWTKTSAALEASTKGLLAIALGAASDDDGMLLRGMVTTIPVAGTPDEGATIYMRASAGAITTSAPSSSGQFVRIIGYCMENSDDRIYFNPDDTYIEIA